VVDHEGVGALWRGNLINCVRLVPYTSLQFFSYNYFKRLLGKSPPNVKETTSNVIRKEKVKGDKAEVTKEASSLEMMTCGLLAALTSTIMLYPLDAMRARLEMPGQTYDSVVAQVREDGFLSLYRGLLPCLLGLPIYVATVFFVNQQLKKLIEKRTTFTPTHSLISGFISGFAAQILTYPFDTLRRRIDVHRGHAGPLIQQFLSESISEWFSGYTCLLLKSPVGMVTTFWAYDTLRTYASAKEE